ncbi:hypothetical protein [Aeromicrobium halocynthiae]
MATMRLGAPVVSAERMQLRRLALFCPWESEDALESFLSDDPIGRGRLARQAAVPASLGTRRGAG